MRRYRYSYHTVVLYDGFVSRHHFLLRCQPKEHPFQRVVEGELHLLPSSNVRATTDCYNNKIVYGLITKSHNIFVIVATGEVECSRYLIEDSNPSMLYLATTKRTAISHSLAAFATANASQGSHLEQALVLANALHNYMEYKSGSTTIDTTSAQAFEQRCGVCQDFSNILISLAIHQGIRARYVAGLVVGTGETHAWVEVHSNGAWHAIDPTHNILVEFDYIKLSDGRDAADCSVTRGTQIGVAAHQTHASVLVESVVHI